MLFAVPIELIHAIKRSDVLPFKCFASWVVGLGFCWRFLEGVGRLGEALLGFGVFLVLGRFLWGCLVRSVGVVRRLWGLGGFEDCCGMLCGW